MRTFVALPIAIAVLSACNPPNPENEPPNIQLLSPLGVYNEATTITTYPADAGVPLDLTFRLRDRDGDEPLSIVLYFDPTPEEEGDVGLEVEVASADGLVPEPTEIPELPDEPDGPTRTVDLVDVMLTYVDGLEEGEQVMVAVADDGTGIGEPRRERFHFQVNASISAPEIAVTPTAPTTVDSLSGALTAPSVDPQGGEPYHDWVWSRTDPADPAVEQTGENFPAILPAVQTTRGETWEFCVTAYESPDGTAPNPNATVQTRTTCESIVIENAAPGAPGAVEVFPERPMPTDTLFCDVSLDATDPDGDAVTYEYDWLLNGSAVVTASSEPWLDPAETAATDVWTCTATSVDASDATPLLGGSLESAGITISAGTVRATDRASRTIEGLSNGLALGTHVGIAPVEQFVAGFPQECLLVGAPTDAAGEGRVNLYRGSAIMPNSPNVTIDGGGVTGFGGPIASGDIEADGNAEAVVVSDGTVWILYSDSYSPGSHDVTAGTGALSVASTATGFGASVAAGDVLPISGNGELLIGTVAAGVANTVAILDGDDLDPADPVIDLDVTPPTTTLTGDGTDDRFGALVQVSGDLTGDALNDVVVADPGGTNAVFVFPGGNGLNGALTTTAAAFTVTSTGGDAGASIATGDVDGDGLTDLVVGAPTSGAGGEVAIFLNATVAAGGSAAFSSADFVLQGDASTAFGSDLAILADPSGLFGDVLLVGAPDADDGTVLGAGFVYAFTPAGLAATSTPGAVPVSEADMSFSGDTDQGGLTVRTAPADLDNDGFADVVLSMPGYEAATNVGRVYVLLSSSL